MRKVCRERKELLFALTRHFPRRSMDEILKLHEALITKCRKLVLVGEQYYNGTGNEQEFYKLRVDLLNLCVLNKVRAHLCRGQWADECEVFLNNKWVNIPIERKIKCTSKK